MVVAALLGVARWASMAARPVPAGTNLVPAVSVSAVWASWVFAWVTATLDPIENPIRCADSMLNWTATLVASKNLMLPWESMDDSHTLEDRKCDLQHSSSELHRSRRKSHSFH